MLSTQGRPIRLLCGVGVEDQYGKKKIKPNPNIFFFYKYQGKFFVVANPPPLPHQTNRMLTLSSINWFMFSLKGCSKLNWHCGLNIARNQMYWIEYPFFYGSAGTGLLHSPPPSPQKPNWSSSLKQSKLSSSPCLYKYHILTPLFEPC